MRTYQVRLDDGRELTVLPPTVRTFFAERREMKTDEEVYRFIAKCYSRNTQGIKIMPEEVLDFTVDDFNNFWDGFIAWVQNEHRNDPN